jgi:methyl-accepting chemotaxis protein
VTATAAAERSDVERAGENLANASKVMTQVAELAAASNRAAEQATSSTVTALGSVNETVKGMEGIRESIAEAEKRIKRLGERSQEITGIVNLINTIAERTHVLALNASMQAAAAGDAGRGFAVVAEEVQRLAESSRQATQQIAQLVNNIQIETSTRSTPSTRPSRRWCWDRKSRRARARRCAKRSSPPRRSWSS